MHVWCDSGIIAWGNKRLTMPIQCRFASVAIDIAALSLPLWLFLVLLLLFSLPPARRPFLAVCLALPNGDAYYLQFVSIRFTISIQTQHYNRFKEPNPAIYAREWTRVLEILHAARRQTRFYDICLYWSALQMSFSVKKSRGCWWDCCDVVGYRLKWMCKCVWACLTWCCLEIEKTEKIE